MREKRQPPSAYFAAKALACNSCRTSKLKCDRVKPCGTCVARGIEGTCYQDTSGERNTSPRQNAKGASPTSKNIDLNLQQVTEALRSQQHTLASLASIITGNGNAESSRKSSMPWQEEVRQTLPPADSCNVLFAFYFDEVSAI